MNFILTTIFLFLFTLFLYGYFSYHNKKKFLPHCDVIYILNDDITDNSAPDFHQARSNELYNLNLKKENRIEQNEDVFWE